MENLNNVDKLIIANCADHISKGIDAMLIVAEKYPDLIVRLTEMTEILAEMVNYANGIEGPSLRPRNQQSILN